MEVSCSCTPQGNFYLFHRVSNDFSRALKPVVPFLLAGHADVLVGRVEDNPTLALRLGPIRGDAELRLRALIQPYLTTCCPPLPA